MDKLIGYVQVDAVVEKVAQLRCENELNAVLDSLHRLVLLSPDLSKERRTSLIRGIGHLRGHIHAETMELCAEECGRLNYHLA